MYLMLYYSEMAQLFGMDFLSALTRGSQFRVESVLIRITKTLNHIMLSPSRSDVQNQVAPECIALVMEPESQFYTDPIVVLDFQSLYPSLMIAYNMCYSTYLGRVVNGVFETHFGVKQEWKIDWETLHALYPNVIMSPNGSVFVPVSHKKGILSTMLQEILSTRIMIKEELKEVCDEDPILARILDARQYALKMIANVTYGYTAASFSGRMPCAPLADAIVEVSDLFVSYKY